MKTKMQKLRSLVRDLNRERIDGFYCQVSPDVDACTRCNGARIRDGRIELYSFHYDAWVHPVGSVVLVNRINETLTIPRDEN